MGWFILTAKRNDSEPYRETATHSGRQRACMWWVDLSLQQCSATKKKNQHIYLCYISFCTQFAGESGGSAHCSRVFIIQDEAVLGGQYQCSSPRLEQSD